MCVYVCVHAHVVSGTEEEKKRRGWKLIQSKVNFEEKKDRNIVYSRKERKGRRGRKGDQKCNKTEGRTPK